MVIGYARVSTSEQNLDLQVDALKKAGCAKIFCDKLSGATTDRPQLKQALSICASGDTLIVWRLDRLGRSLKHLVDTISKLGDQGIGFKTCSDGIDTTTSTGRLVFHIFAALAEFEKSLIKERTLAGLAAARRRGRLGGRPRILSSEDIQLVSKLAEEGYSRKEIAKLVKVSSSTLWRAISEKNNSQK